MWEEVVPIDQNGVITMYQVLYQPLETFGGVIGPLTVNVTELTADLTDLEEYVNYTISVRAYTSAGEGPYSDGEIELTDEDGEFQTVTAIVEPPGCWYAHWCCITTLIMSQRPIDDITSVFGLPSPYG